MVTSRSSIKSLLAVAAIGLISLIAGCGGGGAVTPSCADTNSCPVAVPAPPRLVINPGALNAYAGTPVVVTISSGVGPFQVFTSDATVLPVTQVVPGAAITLVPSNVDSDRAVTLTVRDSAGQSASVAVTVKPSPILGALTLTSFASSPCAGSSGDNGSGTTPAPPFPLTAMCTGETAVAQITLRGANTSVLANRQVRFDVLQGAYNFVTDRDGLVLAKTATILTDQNGSAIVTIKADSIVATQIALLRATDVVSGNRVDTWFTIVQATAGVATFQVSPATAKISGYYVNTCGGGSVSYVIYGGTAPYTVFASSLNGINLEVGDTRGQTVVVPRSGAAFSVVASSSACAGTSTTLLTITDATGRVITASFDLIAGTVALPTPPTPDTLVVTPPDARIVCAVNSVVVFTLSGGTAPYTVATDRPSDSVVTGANVKLLNSLVAGTVINVAIADAKSKTVAAKISCLAPNAPPLLLSLSTQTVASVGGFCATLPAITVTNATTAVTPFTVSLSVPSTIASASISSAGVITITPANAASVPAGTSIGITAFDSVGSSGFASLRCQ